MRCRECRAAEYDKHKREFFCRCTGAVVRISPRSNFVMPLLGVRDKNQNWADGDDDRRVCPATLDTLIGSRNEHLAFSILRQIEQRGELDFCLSLYTSNAANKLRYLMFTEAMRLSSLQAEQLPAIQARKSYSS